MTALAPAATTVPTPPRLGRAIRDAAVDFYYHSWRLAPANVIWTASLVGILIVAGSWPPALVLVPVLAVPGVGLARMAALISRGESVAFGDFRRGMAEGWRRALVVGIGAAILAVVFTSNLLLGLDTGGLVGWTFGTLAGYADLGLLIGLVALWPLLGDPDRQGRRLRDLLRLAGLVVLARPGRMAGLALLLAAFLLLSTVLFAALVTVSVAYAALVSARYVLPVADRLEAGRREPGAAAG